MPKKTKTEALGGRREIMQQGDTKDWHWQAVLFYSFFYYSFVHGGEVFLVCAVHM